MPGLTDNGPFCHEEGKLILLLVIEVFELNALDLGLTASASD